MIVVGLTGASGSGKGYVSTLVERAGIRIIDTDGVYHDMVDRPGACVDALVSAFGDYVLSAEGGINRKKLADIVFSDREKLKRLNHITHAYILDECRRLIAESEKKGAYAVFVDAPQLFESGFDRECDITVGVVSSAATRKARIIERDSITAERAQARIDNQKSDDFFKENCDYVIINDCSDVESQVEELICLIMRLYEKKKKEAQ